MSDSNKPLSQTTSDSTSFASILANVQRLREQQAGSTSSSLNAANTSTATLHNEPIRHNRSLPNQSERQSQRPAQTIHQRPDPSHSLPGKRINSFNQAPRQSPSTTSTDSTSRKRPYNSISSSSTTLKVNKNQTGNPLLPHLTNLTWEYVSRHNAYDYLLPCLRPVIFLSLKYHKLHPEHISQKFKGVRGKDAFLLVLVDVERHDGVLRELNRDCVYEGLTVILGWGWAECGRWLAYLSNSGKA